MYKSENTVELPDIVYLAGLIIIALVIFSPLFYTNYAFTDEFVQLWFYRRGSNYMMFVPQGRYITDKLFYWLFGSIDKIEQIRYIRLFSLGGWILCIPVWYFIIKKIVVREKLPGMLTVLATLYLVCSPQFSISVRWGSCLEMFLANTAGLASGYFFYTSIKNKEGAIRIAYLSVCASLLFGIVSLFTYQNGFGCFLLPFLLHLAAAAKNTKLPVMGVAMYLLTYVLYYLLFKYNLAANHIEASTRTGLHIDPVNKLQFLLGRVLSSSFHLTYIFNEESKAGFIVYIVAFATWMISSFLQKKALTVLTRLKYFVFIFLLFALIYLPGLIVQENYASNRTLLALNMAVFFLLAQTVFAALKTARSKTICVSILSILFIGNAWYNFNSLFLTPVKKEYNSLRSYIVDHYTRETDTVYFIRPEEDFFVRRYQITRSWDEFGVPSSFFSWVPEFFVKQVVFEKTGDRLLADKIKVSSWLGKKAFLNSGTQVTKAILLIDTEEIMK